MNPDASSRTRAFTLVELLVVIGIIGILAALLLPALSKGEADAKRAWCENSLEQMGIAFHTFAHDHNSQFPMGVSTNDGGSLEYVQSGYEAGDVFYFSYRNFQPLGNELTPPILVCPADTRTAATNFLQLRNENLSYFVGVNATFGGSESILAGDRSLVTNRFPTPTILRLEQGSGLRWSSSLHQYKGNVLFADGHVERWNNSALRSAEKSSVYNADLFLPSVPPTNQAPVVAGGGSGFGGGGGTLNSSPGQGSGNPSAVNPSGAGPAARSDKNTVSAQSSPNSGNRPGSMPPGSYNNNNGASQTRQSLNGSENMVFTNKMGPAAALSESNGIPAPADSVPAMSATDSQIVNVAHRVIDVWLWLLLVLLLLYLAYRIFKSAQGRSERQHRAGRRTVQR